MSASDDKRFVSRGGLKLAAALDAFSVDVAGSDCVDLGCSVGGFTDCLLQHGATHVWAVDTAYGELAWKLRQDPRVTVLERTNALHTEVPEATIDLVVIDLGWTRQVYAIPAALRWRPRRIISLIKPQYEIARDRRKSGVLDDQTAHRVAQQVLEELPSLGVRVVDHIRSPIRGGGSRGRQGNHEFLAMFECA